MRKGTIEDIKRFQEELYVKADRADQLENENTRLREGLINIMLEEAQNMEGYETTIFKIARDSLGMSDCEAIKLLEGESYETKGRSLQTDCNHREN